MAEGDFPKTDGDVLYASEINFNIVPVGSVIAWLKDLTNTPSLPDNWVECNGQTLSDSNSVYDGVTIPDLNNPVGSGLKGRFLRGHASSGETESSQNLEHSHTVKDALPGSGEPGFESNESNDYSSTGSSGGDEARPHNYSVVWIMRIE